MSKTTVLPSKITQVVRIYWLLAFSSAILLTAFQWIALSIDFIVAWLVAVNIAAMMAYGYDKSIAGSGRTRIPERLLLTLAYAGGSLGALFGMRIFHHKTRKSSFQLRFWIILIIQAGLLLVYLFAIKPVIH